MEVVRNDMATYGLTEGMAMDKAKWRSRIGHMLSLMPEKQLINVVGTVPNAFIELSTNELGFIYERSLVKKIKKCLDFKRPEPGLLVDEEYEEIESPANQIDDSMQFKGLHLRDISHCLVPRRLICEVAYGIEAVISGIHMLVGYWSGPDSDDGCGYVEAALVQILPS
ncbi:uncharacterized protein LOC18423060 isoform X2 [Amborella trichopoda]|uniref:uncharacterized protein LOC18423060 isoform X2 n=1 Tax=Amborella trichopoda TaxID=13333 RepID=UPI0009BEA5CD|nr:uncharacterized protein LOC18423060 isoform X2 [Amborella trichopoda]|eukprot:XP_020527801.1 uncharacterized protein LOC18423060 isoform X2 [Amborella trichopoda]